MREKADSQIKSLEKDVASIKSGSLSASGNEGQDLMRLKAEVERLEVSTQETLLAQQAKHNLEVSGLQEQLEESERRLRASDLDMASLREKLDQARCVDFFRILTTILPTKILGGNVLRVKYCPIYVVPLPLSSQYCL